MKANPHKMIYNFEFNRLIENQTASINNVKITNEKQRQKSTK